MNSAGKAISIIAKIFAAFLIVAIVGGIMKGVFFAAHNVFDSKHKDYDTDMLISESIESNNVNIFDLDIDYTDLDISLGDEFSYTTDNKYITVSEKYNEITISERDHAHKDRYKLNIVIPRDMEFTEFKISTGAGSVNIEKINTDVLELELGAGEVTVNELRVDSVVDIETGAGTFNVNNGRLSNLSFEMGAGSANLSAEFFGNSEFECGVGRLNINAQNDLSVSVEKGLGTLTINGKGYSHNADVGDSENHIRITGGLGDITVNTANNI